ncbi:N-acetylmuramoyl-L-alanine amidase [Clostridium tertium]|uniref:N-acetylmuramoyl-L-alanine amidase n=1 Tax=Clostridium tertium TaxID=1559 RepID=A0A9X4B331_9CLOT|nr:N-acetylmuramoyl-L-alanine amidase [Clostridium tertium]MDC4240878.1 N-acetylmuramoyl-L-alanine amidase [Clostridium tertium]
MKILLIAGHGAGDPGACSNYGVEATETRRVVEMLKVQFGLYDGVSVDVYPIERNAYADIGAGALQVNFANYDYVLEVHFNSAANASATGVEIWVTPVETGITVEQAIVNKVSSLGYANRGVKREDFRVIRTVKNRGVSAALIETCFISNQGDMDRYNNNFAKVCNAIVEGVAEGYGLNKNNNIVYDESGKVIYSYVVSNKKYLNLKPHVTSWRVYPLDKAPVVGNECAKLAPATYGGLSYKILEDKGDIKIIKTEMFGKVQIYAPRDNDSSITENPIY